MSNYRKGVMWNCIVTRLYSRKYTDQDVILLLPTVKVDTRELTTYRSYISFGKFLFRFIKLLVI